MRSATKFSGVPAYNPKKASPYLIEGYYVVDEEMKPTSLLPKGIEIRTPLRNSIEESINVMYRLYELLRSKTLENGQDLAALSYHPTEKKFDAPPNYQRHDYWQWALVATTTFGPDINISVPDRIKVDQNRLAERINFYMPHIVALTLASPLVEGGLWKVRGRNGKSIRTFRRSIWAPMFYVHEKPSLRFEFKGFEMSRCLEDYHAFFLISLALLLDDKLNEKAADESRIYELGRVAVEGLEANHTVEICNQVLESAERMAAEFGFRRDALEDFWVRLQNRHVPADEIIATFEDCNSISATMAGLTGLYSRGSLPELISAPNKILTSIPNATRDFSIHAGSY